MRTCLPATTYPTSSAERTLARVKASLGRLIAGDRGERLVMGARFVILFEQIWRALWPAAGFVIAAAVLALVDGFALMAWPLHAALLYGLLGAGAFFFGRGLLNVRWPRRDDSLRRLETENGFANRPLSEGEDTLALGGSDPAIVALWQRHLARARARLAEAGPARPRPGLPARDPHALRGLAFISLVAAAAIAGDAWDEQLSRAFDIGAPPRGAVVSGVDAWVTPPAYTRLAPIFLSSADGAINAAGDPVNVPAGSELVIRVQGIDGVPTLDGAGEVPFNNVGTGSHEAKLVLNSDVVVSIDAAGATMARLDLRVVPDRLPAVTFSGPPEPTRRGTLKLAYAIDDDYGAVSAQLTVTLDRPETGVPLEAQNQIAASLPVPPRNRGSGDVVAYPDLSAHAWAGLPVVLRIAVTDGAGQTGYSQEMRFVLPERVFLKPLAAALAELRKVLLLDPARAASVAGALDALALEPETYTPEIAIYAGLRSAYWRLLSAETPGDIESVAGLLHELAVAVEDGEAAMAAEELRRLQEALMDALANGASEEEISQLMQQLRQAMDEYMRALAENSDPIPLPPGLEMPGTQDLSELLDAIEEMARTGARDAARELLEQLQALMDSMPLGGQQGLTEGEQAMAEALQGLSEIIERQRDLMDRTYQEQQRQEDPYDTAPGADTDAMAGEQGTLEDELGVMGESLGEQGIEVPENLGNAGEAMERAEGTLREGEAGRAVPSQQEALDQLQQGMQAMAQALADSLAARGSGIVSRGGRPSDQGRDPLGRPEGARGNVDSNDVLVPDERATQRAREILEEIERRASERGRPREELDYLERLLERFE